MGNPFLLLPHLLMTTEINAGTRPSSIPQLALEQLPGGDGEATFSPSSLPELRPDGVFRLACWPGRAAGPAEDEA